jgi:hypothetical protein
MAEDNHTCMPACHGPVSCAYRPTTPSLSLAVHVCGFSVSTLALRMFIVGGNKKLHLFSTHVNSMD